jgi:acyl transferase domain-containing protein/surfactin synthase thioesterase subunit
VTPDEEISRLKALLRKSLSTIHELNSRVNERPDGNCAEPIAIVGMACELPGGADSPEAFWTLLESGTTCERDGPTDEWRQEVFGEYFAGRPAAAHFAAANYLDRDIMQFDPRAFNIAPAEARDMDPTQRLALELTAQALERAGYNPWQVPGTVGVYFGVIGGEYGVLARQSSRSGQYVATGSLDSVVSGRINHTFDFTGPSVSIDTACSSSLVALHLACEAIRHGDCDTAVVGGVNLLQDPSAATALAAFGALSPDGRCRPFTGDGTGYGRGEGAAVVVLKRLDTARRAGDQILATVRATAVNHDGRCSGLTVPNGKAQQQLLAGAVRKSGLRGADLDYLETHGTGTALGDPIELAAVGAVYGQDRATDRPLIVASNKAQIGHLEAASGMASLLKVVLVLQHGRVPAQAGADTLSPHIDFEGLMLRVPRTGFELPKRPAIAAVSAFGFSGTNAHAILTGGEDTAMGTDPAHADLQRHRYGLVLSARSAAALAQTVDRCIDHLQAAPQLAAADVCFSYAVGRAHGPYRTHVTGADRSALLRALRMHASTPRHVSRSRLTRSGAVQVSFFPAGFVPAQPDPRSPQWYRRFAGYRRGFGAIARGWTARTGTTLPRGGAPTVAPDELACHQLAVLCGLIELLRSLGIEPQLWCPHGIGVYAVALQTGARGVDGVIAELAELFAHDPPPPMRTSGGFDVLPVPAGGRAASDELAPTHFEAAVICQSSVDFVDSRRLHEPDYWGRAAASLADPRRVAARCVEHGTSVAVLFGQGVSAVELVDTLQVVQLDNPGALDAAGDAADEVLALLLRLYELGMDVNWAEWYADSVVRRVRLPTSVFERASYVFEWTQRAGGGVLSGDPLEPRVHPSPGGSETTALFAAASEEVSSTVPPLHLETVVCRLVSELTGVPAGEISISDTTTSLGVDSLQATRLYRALEPLNPHDRVTLPRLIQGVAIGDLASALSLPSEPISGVGPDTPRRDRHSTAPPRSTSGRANSYFQPQLADPQLRLLCVPYGGGSGLLYQGWQRGLPAGWEVCPVTLPGHGSRLDEPLVPDVCQVVDELTEEVLRLGEEPIAVYGHSAGALIGFLLAARLQAAGHPGLRRLYLAAFSSPNAEGNPFHQQCQARLHAVGYPDFPTADEVRKMTPVQLQRLARAFGFSGLDRADPQLLRTAMPILTNDIRMVASYRHDGVTLLTAPISALHGHRDDRVTEQQVRDWAHWTTAPCRIHVLDGDHYFLHPDQCRDQVLEIVANGVAVLERCP